MVDVGTMYQNLKQREFFPLFILIVAAIIVLFGMFVDFTDSEQFPFFQMSSGQYSENDDCHINQFFFYSVI